MAQELELARKSLVRDAGQMGESARAIEELKGKLK
jgi:hypothetical protein